MTPGRPMFFLKKGRMCNITYQVVYRKKIRQLMASKNRSYTFYIVPASLL